MSEQQSNQNLRHRLMMGHAEKLILAQEEPKPISIPFEIEDKKYEIVIKEADDE